MFNYQFELSEPRLWAEMGSEIIPLKNIPHQVLHGRMAKFVFFYKIKNIIVLVLNRLRNNILT